jgi:iron complex transport system substrate-binding protein
MKRYILFAAGLFFSINAWALRIVSLSPYLTESLMLLGGQEYLVGITTISKDLFNLDIDSVGDTININIEKILLLDPDIILATPMNKIERIERLRELGLKVEYFYLEKSFEDCRANFLRLSELINKTAEAELIIAQAERRLKNLSKNLESEKTASIFIEISSSPLITAGRDSYFEDLARYAKVKNIAGNIESGFFRVSREEVLRLDPDYILIISQDYPYSFKRWQEYNFLTAVKNNNLIRLDDNIFSRPNPLNFVEAVSKLVSKLYPEISIED